MKDTYQSVTNTIIAALEAGTPPWVCPWNKAQGSLAPANLSTGRAYRGINVLLLNVQAMSRGYATNRWMTYSQARAIGACVRKGETGTGIVFFKLLERDDDGHAAANDEGSRKVIPLLRSFTVFNASQIEGLPEALKPSQPPIEEWVPIGAADALLSRSGAVIRHGGDRAYYRPSDDVIQLPPPAAFDQSGSYYATALHELCHWSGAPDRCNRVLLDRQHIGAYALEELIAEMGAAFLSSHCGLPGELQHASYIQSWLTALKNDKRLIFTAASLAQKAADYLIGNTVEETTAITAGAAS
jgi:antirestriction protein ArdC